MLSVAVLMANYVVDGLVVLLTIDGDVVGVRDCLDVC